MDSEIKHPESATTLITVPGNAFHQGLVHMRQFRLRGIPTISEIVCPSCLEVNIMPCLNSRYLAMSVGAHIDLPDIIAQLISMRSITVAPTTITIAYCLPLTFDTSV